VENRIFTTLMKNDKMIENEFAPYDLALAMKELGFDESTLFTYYRKKIGYIKNSIKGGTPPNLPFPQYVPAPTYSQAFRWFREEHGLVKQDYLFFKKNVRNAFNISKDDGENLYDSCYNSNDEEVGDGFSTYEEAEFACLNKLIEIVNQTKDE
jgi:hypothetical protein